MSSQAIVIMVLSEVAQFLVVDKALEKITGRRANKEKTKMTNVTFESIRNAMKTNQGTVGKAKVVQEKVVEVTKKTVGAIGGVMPVTNNKLDDRTGDILSLLAATQLEVQDLKRQLGIKTNVDYNEVNNLASTYLQFMKNGAKEEEVDPAPMNQPTEEVVPVSEVPQYVLEAKSIKETQVVEEAVTETPVPSEKTVEVPPTQEPTVAQDATMNPLHIQFDTPNNNWHMGPQV
jgi:hypothetical protein